MNAIILLRTVLCLEWSTLSRMATSPRTPPKKHTWPRDVPVPTRQRWFPPFVPKPRRSRPVPQRAIGPVLHQRPALLRAARAIPSVTALHLLNLQSLFLEIATDCWTYIRPSVFGRAVRSTVTMGWGIVVSGRYSVIVVVSAQCHVTIVSPIIAMTYFHPSMTTIKLCLLLRQRRGGG